MRRFVRFFISLVNNHNVYHIITRRDRKEEEVEEVEEVAFIHNFRHGKGRGAERARRVEAKLERRAMKTTERETERERHDSDSSALHLKV